MPNERTGARRRAELFGSLLPPEKAVALHHQTLTCRIKRCDGTPHLRNRLHCPWRNVVSFGLQINSQGNLAGPGNPVDVRRNGVQLLQDAVDVEFRPFCHSIRHFSPPDTIDKYGRRPSDLNELVAGRRKRLRPGSKLQPPPTSCFRAKDHSQFAAACAI